MCNTTVEACPICDSDNVGEYYRQSAETSDGTQHQARMFCFACGHFWFAEVDDDDDYPQSEPPTYEEEQRHALDEFNYWNYYCSY